MSGRRFSPSALPLYRSRCLQCGWFRKPYYQPIKLDLQDVDLDVNIFGNICVYLAKYCVLITNGCQFASLTKLDELLHLIIQLLLCVCLSINRREQSIKENNKINITWCQTEIVVEVSTGIIYKNNGNEVSLESTNSNICSSWVGLPCIISANKVPFYYPN